MKTSSTLALLLSLAAMDAQAQHAGHALSTSPAPAPTEDASIAGTRHDRSMHATRAAQTSQGPSAPATADAHAGHHSATMGDARPPTGHGMSMHTAPATPTQATASEHAGHDMSTMGDARMPVGHAMHEASTIPRTPVPAPTDADRAAAFPALAVHTVHDRGRFGFLRVDRLERDDDGGTGWEAIGWYGGDIHRAWLRTEGHATDGGVEDASVELLYGRLVAPWWDAVAGLRQDAGDGPSRTWAAFGVQGVAPYKFEVRATGYVGTGGRTAARLEGEYDTLLSRRWVLQWRGEADLYGRDDPALGIGRGLSTVGAGVRLRYEITRRFAPYVGVEHERAFGRTATLRALDGHAVRDTRVVAGLRLAF